jgi:hypothetical protein
VYQLTFGTDGSISVTADCNRATGAISVWDPPRLQFGELAATLALCGPDSLADRYLRQLGWVRSYVYQDDHLYLATMADGSILNFAPGPAAEASATVGSLSLVVDDADALRGIVLARLLDHYASSAGIAAQDVEIDAYLARLERALRSDPGDAYDDGSSLSDEEQAEVARMRRSMANAVIRQWKINKALYEEYGGRIIYQQLGPEPLDAYLAFLENAQEAGQFAILDAELGTEFWYFFRDEKRHDFMPKGSRDESEAFSTPPWEAGGN